VPFEVACLCGHVLRGARLHYHQVLRCGRCGGSVFVLPLSPLPPLPNAPAAGAEVVTLPRGTSARSHLRLPLLIGFALVLLGVGGWLLWLALTPLTPPASDEGVPGTPAAVEAHLRAAGTHLDQGEVRLALKELTAAEALARRRPQWLAPEQAALLRRLRAQAGVLADLLDVSLEEVVGHADALAPAEWQALCAERYRGRAFALDVTVRVRPGGRVEHDYLLFVHGEAARLRLDDLALLHGLPLEQPQRVLLACRLADVRRAPGQPWVVTVQPDSGVLLTEPGAAHVCGLDPHADDVRQVLQRQARWLAEK
jgi:hypothetical protein